MSSHKTYVVTCGRCNGKGTLDHRTACVKCKGYGQVRSPSPIMDVTK